VAEPVADRLHAQSPGGVLGPSGVARFRACYSGQDKAELFHQWASLTGTRLFRDALRDLALHAPAPADSDNHLVQYGISLGLSLAARLAEDPSSVFPELFASAEKGSAFNPLVAGDAFTVDPFDDPQEK